MKEAGSSAAVRAPREQERMGWTRETIGGVGRPNARSGDSPARRIAELPTLLARAGFELPAEALPISKFKATCLATLERVQKDATAECVQCHVVGFDRPGGYVNAQTTSKLKDVGCESCHGYGTRHEMFKNTGGKVAEAVCLTCHTPANDQGWNYAAKLPRVSH